MSHYDSIQEEARDVASVLDNRKTRDLLYRMCERIDELEVQVKLSNQLGSGVNLNGETIQMIEQRLRQLEATNPNNTNLEQRIEQVLRRWGFQPQPGHR